MPTQLTEQKRMGDEGDDGTQHALIEGKVHIPRSLRRFLNRSKESKNHPPLHIHHPVGPGPALKVDFLTPTFISQLVGTIQRDV